MAFGIGSRAPRGWFGPAWGVLVALMLLLGCSGEIAQLPALEPNDRLLAFGNSLTHGTGATAEASYPAVLSDFIGREVINAGKPGELSGAGRERLSETLDETTPDLLLLCHGGNDFLKDRDPEKIKANLRAMVRDARGRGVPVVLIGVPGRNLTMATSPIYRELATELDVPLVEDAVASVLSEEHLRADRVHPNAAGYRRLAAAVHEVLARAGAVEAP